MVYHASCGDRELAEGLAYELIEYARHDSPPLVAIRYLRHGAHVLSCFGASEVALGVMMESFEWAKSLNAHVSMAVSAGLLSSFHMQNGDNNCAKTWIDCAFAAHNPAVLIVADLNMWSYRAEVSLRLCDSVDAETAVELFQRSRVCQVRKKFARYRSLQTQFMFLSGHEINERFSTRSLLCMR